MKLKVGMRPNKEIDDALDFIIDEIAQIAGSILDEKIKEEQGPANPNEFLFVCYQIALQVIQRFVMKFQGRCYSFAQRLVFLEENHDKKK
ncbi:MAG: hypothetical protein DRH06_00420 [Deltaproteobacteria bacterium]|nr:MAG: hypothetical protein DRH06_00420 [Deltaproteobacteria bacterium]